MSKIQSLFHNLDVLKKGDIRLLVLYGLSECELHEYAKIFCATNSRKKIASVWERVAEGEGDVLIVSNALNFVVKEFMDQQHVPCLVIGSTLAYEEGKCSGRYRHFILHKGKKFWISFKLGLTELDDYYTDDPIADEDILGVAKNKYLVIDGEIKKC